MGQERNGSRTFLNLLRDACKMSHLPGFRAGLTKILGPDDAATVYALWTPLCGAVEAIISLDDHFNQIDYRAEQEGDEDLTEAI